MKTHFSIPSRPVSTQRGFTLVELLVVIVIIIALAFVSFTVTRSARRSAVKVADMSNLRSLANAVMAAGSDSAGKLPKLHSGSYAPYWVVGRATLESYGINKEGCYFPRPGVVGGAPNYDWWYKLGSDTAVPIHYVYFANDAEGSSSPWYTQGTVVKPKREEYRGGIPYDTIILDSRKAFPRSFSDDSWYPVLWSSLISDFPGRSTIAPLMDSKNKPLGLNVIYLDGHAEWKDARTTQVRYTHPQGLKLMW
jgi:prepilin-type N-terminal cleavage/methylation domain-containing protein